MAYTVKMPRKINSLRDYTGCKLETVYSMSAGGSWDTTLMAQWGWKMMIRTPGFVKSMQLEQAVIALKKKGKAPETDQVALETIKEDPDGSRRSL